MSQLATFRDMIPEAGKPYAPGGCPIHVGQAKCGETQGLEIIMDFQKLYQEKMKEIDVSAGGDSLQEKMNLQQQWIHDLTEQNFLLARVIQELESQTIGKIQQMEDRLNHSMKALSEADEHPLDDKGNKIGGVQDDLEKKGAENARLKQDMEEMRKVLTEEIIDLRGEIYKLQEKNLETLKETSIKDDIIKELRRELKKSKQKVSSSRKDSEKSKKETADKGVWVRETQVQTKTITHSNIPQETSNSAIIIIHRREDQNVKEAKAKFDSSDSSECGITENAYEGDRVQTCRSENDIKSLDWTRPTRERSILTKIRKEANEDMRGNHGQERSPKRLNIPRHIPVKTYVNNIEYNRELE